MLTRWRRALVLLVSLLVLVLAGRPAHAAEAVRLWHSYRGAEREALEKLVEETFPGTVTLLAVPYDAFSAKLSAAIPLGTGPHLFIDAHERLGSYREQRLVAPVGDLFDPADFLPAAVDAVTLEGKAYALPLSLKSVALYYRTDLVSGPPETIEGLADRLRAPLPQGSYLLAYESRGVYMHAPILHAFGGRLLGPDGQFGFVGPEAEASLIFAKDLADRGVTPKAADGALVTRLFVAGKAAYAISGPWLPSDLGPEVPFAVTPLPKLAATGEPLRPLLKVEAVMLSPEGAKFERARSVARMLASVGPAIEREHIASAVSARRDLPPPADPVVAAFAAQAREAVPMSSSVAMRAVWEPAEKALRKVLAGTATPSEALAEAKRRFDDVQRAPAPPASPTPLLVVAGLLLLLGAALLVRRVRRDDFRETLRDSVPAYRYVAHAVVALGLLVFAPLLAGAFISLYAGP
ncbi:MAG: extracellular solute-binding protein, partial [Myxococcales bacterium]|nr:extracellular solute-binding protein [Myxococcales bacterium]